MQHEEGQFIALGIGWATSGSNDFPKFEAISLLGDAFEIMREVILAVHKDDFFGASSDVQVAIANDAEIACIEPALGINCAFVGDGIFELTVRDVGATNQDPTHSAVSNGAAVQRGNLDGRARNRPTDIHQWQGLWRVSRGDAGRSSRIELVTIEALVRVNGPGRRERDRQGGFRQSVNREHGAARKTIRGHVVHKFITQRDRDGFRAIEDQANRRQVDAFQLATIENFQEVPVSEVR